jgi:hypothetical protein
MSHYLHIRERCRSSPHVTKIEDSRGQTKFRRQRLDWAGQHGAQGHSVQSAARFRFTMRRTDAAAGRFGIPRSDQTGDCSGRLIIASISRSTK